MMDVRAFYVGGFVAYNVVVACVRCRFHQLWFVPSIPTQWMDVCRDQSINGFFVVFTSN